MVWNAARHGSRNVTLHRPRLSAYSRDLSQPHSWITVCIQEQKSVCTCHPCIERVTFCVVFPCCIHNSPITQHALLRAISIVTEDTLPHVTSERQNPDTTLDPRCQSGRSARNSFDPEEGRFSKDCGGRPRQTADFGSSF